MTGKLLHLASGARRTHAKSMEVDAIVTGVTGMVGEGVLHECLHHPDVASVLVISRRPCGVAHEKLTEIIHTNFHDLSAIKSQLSGYNACFFCAGISSVGKKEAEYTRLTYDLTMHVAGTLARLNPSMTFCYVSGLGTDSTENGRSMWARVKGKTENDLMKLPFKATYMFRPGYIQPTKGLKHAYAMHAIIGPLYPVWKALFPGFVCRLDEIGLAMVNTVLRGSQVRILDNRDIVRLAHREVQAN